MIIVLRPEATQEDLDHIVKKLHDLGLQAHVSKGVERTLIGAIGDETVLRTIPLEAFRGVEKVLPILKATIKDGSCREDILAGGNHQVILCERGIRTNDTATRNTLDLSAVPVVKQMTHLPIIVDPSHAVGRWDLVAPMAKAAVAAGADGLLIEVHANPEEAPQRR
jgi:hypothetical protein